MAQLNKETQQVTKQVTKDVQVVTGMTLDRKEAYILAVIGTMNQSNARAIARNMKATLGNYGLTEADLKDFFTKIEGPELVIPEGLPKVYAYKVGDKVRIKGPLRGGTGSGLYVTPSMVPMVGQVHEVTTVLHDRVQAGGWFWMLDMVEPVTEAPAEEPSKVPGKFSVGDRVVAVADCSCGYFDKGQKGTVEYIDRDGDYGVKWDSGHTLIAYSREVALIA